MVRFWAFAAALALFGCGTGPALGGVDRDTEGETRAGRQPAEGSSSAWRPTWAADETDTFLPGRDAADVDLRWPSPEQFALTRASLPADQVADLPAAVTDAVVYARTLLNFEGQLTIPSEEPPTYSGEDPYRSSPPTSLEELRRYQPMGFCSMDTWPQQVAELRAEAAAEAGHAGWAVQGWIGTVGYWTSPRMVASSYGQAHPEGHLTLLRRVGVNPERLLVGLLITWRPGERNYLALADVRRVVPDLGESFAADLRVLAQLEALDPVNRARAFAAVAPLPFEEVEGYADLPAESQALLTEWSQ